MLRVQLLGEITAVRDGRPVPLSGPHRRLLAFLALHPGPHERDALAARFWPDTPAARANLRTAVWALRRALGPDAVPATRTTVALAATRDVDDDDPGAADRVLCPGLDDDWVETARAAHRRRRVALLDARAAAAADPAEAAHWSARRCALTPLDEPAHRQLVERLAATGDRAAALLAGRELAERLRAELGVAPAPATRALLARVRGPGGGVEAVACAPMFGRAGELAVLTGAWAAARGGRGGVVAVVGEAGIGKTRLVRELARRADNAGARVAVSAGVDVGGEAPLAMWQELARTLVGVVPPPSDRAGWPVELGRLAPDLTRALGRHGVPPVAAPELERLRVFDAVLRLVEWAAAGRPVLLVAEDVHRADRASLALSAHIGRRLAGLPVLLVLTRRDRPARPEADALLADLAGRGVAVTEVELRPLPTAELTEVVRSTTGDALPGPVVAEVLAAADGNPLLAVESARAAAAGTRTPPRSLRAVVQAALATVPDDARALAEALAAAGRGLSAAELDALPAPVAVQRRVLDTGLTTRAGGVLRYRHALLAEAARADLHDPEGTHHAVALAVEAAGPGDGARAAEVARHLQRAGRDDLAGPRFARAARHARELGALPEATTFWAEAVRCAPGDAAARFELAEVHGWSGRAAAFEQEWRDALARVAPADRAAAWCRRGRVLKTVVCDPAAALVAYREAARLLPPDAPAASVATVLVGTAWSEASAGDPDRSGPLLARAAALVPDPDDELRAEIETARLFTAIRLGRFTDCAELAERAAAAIGPVLRPDLLYVVWINTACALACAGDLDGALRTADRGVVATRDVPVLAVPHVAARAHLLARLGRADEADAAAHDLLAVAGRLDSTALLAVARHDAGLVALATGRPRAAADLLAAALADDAAVSRPAARLARAEALAACGDADAAAAELRRAVLEPVGPADQPWALVPRVARVQGLVARARADGPLARRRFEEAAAGWRRLCGTGSTAGRRAGEEFMAVLVDLGRPPVVGLVEPDRELARAVAELAELEDTCTASP